MVPIVSGHQQSPLVVICIASDPGHRHLDSLSVHLGTLSLIHSLPESHSVSVDIHR